MKPSIKRPAFCYLNQVSRRAGAAINAAPLEGLGGTQREDGLPGDFKDSAATVTSCVTAPGGLIRQANATGAGAFRGRVIVVTVAQADLMRGYSTSRPGHGGR